MTEESGESSNHMEDGLQESEELPLVPIDDPELAGLPPVPIPPPLPDLENYVDADSAIADGAASPVAHRDLEGSTQGSEDATSSSPQSDSTAGGAAPRKRKNAATKVCRKI
jgi:hypothetical protein